MLNIGLASGCSDDWAKVTFVKCKTKFNLRLTRNFDYEKGGAGIKYSYTVEMRDKGTFGFQLPAK